MMDWSVALDACLVHLAKLMMIVVSYSMPTLVRWRDYRQSWLR